MARAVAKALSAKISVRLVDLEFTDAPPAGAEAISGDIRLPEFAKQVVADRDTVLHLAPVTPPNLDELSGIEYATRGTYVLFKEAIDAGIRQFVTGSSLDLFDGFPAQWAIDEDWKPQPRPTVEHLRPWLAELSAYEMLRFHIARGICLRFGRIVTTAEAEAQPYDPLWLHLDDAVQGVKCALSSVENKDWRGWHIHHITPAGKFAKIRLQNAVQIGYEPVHDFRAQFEASPKTASAPRPWRDVVGAQEPIPSRNIHKVVMFGAGGPVAAVAYDELASSFQLRLTDVIPIGEITSYNGRQSKEAPLPRLLPPPHEFSVVDVCDAAQVDAACEGMDSIVNCTVVRPDLEKAFRVNTIGAYNVVKSAVKRRIRRVVHTGPMLFNMDREGGDRFEYDTPGDVPPRPGRNLYAHTKYLGQEICKVFAYYYGLEIPALYYCQFLNAESTTRSINFSVTWNDSARAIRRAIEVPSLPSPFEPTLINADMPHGMISNAHAKQLLGWLPRDDYEIRWQDREYEG